MWYSGRYLVAATGKWRKAVILALRWRTCFALMVDACE